jgi:hypothetical protein
MSNSIWNDMLFLRELNDEMHAESSPLIGDDPGYREYPRDPRWLVLLTIALCVLTALSLFGIIWWNLRG